MPRMKGIISVIVCLSFLSASCAATINRQGYVLADSTVSRRDCASTIVVKSLEYDPQLVQIVGRISASDSGFSVHCSEELIMEIFKKDACAVGADIINITKEAQPNFWRSTCYRAKAEFLRLKDREKLNELKSDQRYSTQNIAGSSNYTNCMNKGIVAVGVLGGIIGGQILDSICKSRYLVNDEENNQSVHSSDKNKGQ